MHSTIKLFEVKFSKLSKHKATTIGISVRIKLTNFDSMMNCLQPLSIEDN